MGKLHSGIKPYQCSHCGKRFTRNYTLRLHKQKVCTEEKILDSLAGIAKPKKKYKKRVKAENMVAGVSQMQQQAQQQNQNQTQNEQKQQSQSTSSNINSQLPILPERQQLQQQPQINQVKLNQDNNTNINLGGINLSELLNQASSSAGNNLLANLSLNLSGTNN